MSMHTFCVRVRYSETDVMGFLHHSNYARYYETARWELFRNLGVPYNQLEQDGYILPVISMNEKFVKPARYDEQLTIITKVKQVLSPRITFVYKMYNEQQELINKAEIAVAFVNKKSGKVCDVPPCLLDRIAETVELTEK